MKFSAKALFLCAVLAATGGFAAAPPEYRITRTVALGAPDRWDYVVFDPVLSRVYVAHADTVIVVDAGDGHLIANIAGLSGVTHGVASVHALDKGYTDDSESGSVFSFDLKTLKVIHRIKAEPDADGIVYDPPSGHVLVIDGDSGKVTVIEPKTDAAVATIDGGGGLEFGVSGGNSKFYVDGAEKHEIVRMDTTTNAADAHWPMPDCVKPHGLAIDRANMILFASCANKIMTVMDAKSGAVLANLPIGEGSDFAEFDEGRKLAFSSNRDGTLSIIAEKSPKEFAVLPSVPTAFGARTMAFDAKSGRIFLVTAGITVNAAAAPSDVRRRYSVTPGSAKLLFLDRVSD